MKSFRFLLALLLGFFATSNLIQARDADNPYIGGWGMELPGGGTGWLGVEPDGQGIEANMLWVAGSVFKLDGARIDGDNLVLTRIHRDRNKKPDGTTSETKRTETITVTRDGDNLKFVSVLPNANGNGEERSEFTGKRLPPMPPAPNLHKVKFGKKVHLFDGNNMDAWKLVEPDAANGWSVKDGLLCNVQTQEEGKPHKNYGNLRTVEEFEDFKLHAETRLPKEGNSGIYLRGIYEVQVEDSYGKPLDPHNMGAVYSRITPTASAEKPAGEWQTLDITFVKRHATVVLNGIKIIDNKPVLGPTGGALWPWVDRPGPIYLQGDHTGIEYRNIYLQPAVELTQFDIMKTRLVQLASTGGILAALATHVLAEEKPESFVVDSEHFTIREIVDPKMNNMVAYHFSAPKDWRDSSDVRWNLTHIVRPMTVSASIENPTNAEAFYFFHPLICGYLPGPRAAMREGKDGLDGLFLYPMQPVPALTMFIKKNRSQYSDLKFIGSRDLPDLPKAFHADFATTQHGIGIKVTYTMDGKPVEEEFYAIHYYQLVQGESLWGLGCVHSFRAPAGTLERRRNVFAAIPKSFLITPEFVQRVMAVKQKLSANYASVMRANAAEVANARQRSQQLTASENQFLANVDQSLAASRASRASASAGGDSGSGGGAARTGNDAQDDYIRGVETMNDPDTGTSQHSFLQQYHWTDGYGNYRNSNDANYDPNHAENGNWQLMTPAQ